jgi:MFS family permease
MNLRFVIPMMLTSFFELSVISIMRVTTSYRAIELDLSAAWIGILTAAFSILPVFLALRVGRFIDQGNDEKVVWAGTSLLVLSCAGFALTESITALLIFSALLGTGHLLLSIGMQVLCARQPGGPGTMERMLGNYMIATAIGQGAGPAIVGWAGGSAAIPPTHFLFTIGFGFAILSLLFSLVLRSKEKPTPPKQGAKPMPVTHLFRVPGFTIVFAVSIVTVVAQDLIVVYLPLLGTERNLGVDVVGSLLAVRAVSAVVSRLGFATLHRLLGTTQLLMISTMLGAVAYLCLAAPFPLYVMYPAIAVLGGALGIAVTAAISSVLSTVSNDVRGTANSLRTGGTRFGQVVIPFLAGLLAAAMGIAAVFVVVGASLAITASAVRLRKQGA